MPPELFHLAPWWVFKSFHGLFYGLFFPKSIYWSHLPLLSEIVLPCCDDLILPPGKPGTITAGYITKTNDFCPICCNTIVLALHTEVWIRSCTFCWVIRCDYFYGISWSFYTSIALHWFWSSFFKMGYSSHSGGRWGHLQWKRCEALSLFSFPPQVAVCCICFFVILPLNLVGTILGRNLSGQPNFPCRVNAVPRPIPEKKWYVFSPPH